MPMSASTVPTMPMPVMSPLMSAVPVISAPLSTRLARMLSAPRLIDCAGTRKNSALTAASPRTVSSELIVTVLSPPLVPYESSVALPLLSAMDPPSVPALVAGLMP